MENLKLISVRMYPETLQKLNELALRKRYWTRSTIVNNIVTAIIDNADEKDIMELMQYWPHGSTKLKISVEASSL